MKLRQGFVSNSSSSSFVLATTLANHQKAFDQLNEFEKAVVKEVMNGRSSFLGQKLIVGEVWNDSGTSMWDEMSGWINIPEEIDDDSYDAIYEAWEKYQTLTLKNKEEVFSWSIDW